MRVKAASATFSFEDVRELVPGWISDYRVEVWLDGNRKHIEDAMVRAGWDAIETLLSEDGISMKEHT